MALGICKECDKLVPIKPGDHKPGPAPEHDKPDGGQCIEGPKRPI